MFFSACCAMCDAQRPTQCAMCLQHGLADLRWWRASVQVMEQTPGAGYSWTMQVSIDSPTISHGPGEARSGVSTSFASVVSAPATDVTSCPMALNKGQGRRRRTQDAGRRTQDAGRRTQDAGRWTLDAGRWIPRPHHHRWHTRSSVTASTRTLMKYCVVEYWNPSVQWEPEL
jgi:hypothetical protein